MQIHVSCQSNYDWHHLHFRISASCHVHLRLVMHCMMVQQRLPPGSSLSAFMPCCHVCLWLCHHSVMRRMQELEDRQALEQAMLQKQLSMEAAGIEAEFLAYKQQFAPQHMRASWDRHQSPLPASNREHSPTRQASPAKTAHRRPSPTSAWSCGLTGFILLIACILLEVIAYASVRSAWCAGILDLS